MPSPTPSPTPYPTQAECSDLIDGGGWTMVRHTAGSGGWGPFTDDLQGTDDVGPQGSGLDSYHWTVPWDSKMVGEFLFATGDCAHWLIATPSAVGGSLTGEFYGPGSRTILKSSTSSSTYAANWYNR